MSRAVIAQVNRALRANARKERLVRDASGYRYIAGGESHTWHETILPPTDFDVFQYAWSAVFDLYRKQGIFLTQPR